MFVLCVAGFDVRVGGGGSHPSPPPVQRGPGGPISARCKVGPKKIALNCENAIWAFFWQKKIKNTPKKFGVKHQRKKIHH